MGIPVQCCYWSSVVMTSQCPALKPVRDLHGRQHLACPFGYIFQMNQQSNQRVGLSFRKNHRIYRRPRLKSLLSIANTHRLNEHSSMNYRLKNLTSVSHLRWSPFSAINNSSSKSENVSLKLFFSMRFPSNIVYSGLRSGGFQVQ